MRRLKESGVNQTGSGLGVEWNKNIYLLLADEQRQVLAKLRKKLKDDLASLEELRLKDNSKYSSSPEYLKYHQRILEDSSHPILEGSLPSPSRFNCYYWQIPHRKTGGSVLVSEYNVEEYPSFPGKITLWAGPISRLDVSLRALVVDQIYTAYAHELIKVEEAATLYINEHFPDLEDEERTLAIAQYQRDLEAKLLLEICHSYREDYVLALAFATLDSDPKTQYLIGSIGAAKGQAGQLFWPASRNSPDFDQESSLATQNLLRYSLDPKFAHLADLSEDQFVEITRLHTVPPNVKMQFDAEVRQKVSQALMYFIHLGVQENFTDENFIGAVYEICNTRPALHRGMKQYGLGVELLAQPETLSVAPSVIESSVGNYFRHHVSVPQILRVDGSAKVAGVSFKILP